MIVSTYRKSYDTADGTEQLHDARTTTPTERREKREALQQWADDGGPVNEPVPPPAAPVFPAKPAWSVQSLHDLLAAIRTEELHALTRLEHEALIAHAAADRARASYEQQLLAAEREGYPWSLNVAPSQTEPTPRDLGAERNV